MKIKQFRRTFHSSLHNYSSNFPKNWISDFKKLKVKKFGTSEFSGRKKFDAKADSCSEKGWAE